MRPNTCRCAEAMCPDLILRIRIASCQTVVKDLVEYHVCQAANNQIPNNLAVCPTGYLDRKLTRGTDPEGVD